MTAQVSFDEAKKRAESRAIAEEMAIMQKEQQEAQRKEQARQLDRAQAEQQADQAIIRELSGLQEYYAARQKAYEALEAAVWDFQTAESKIKPALDRALDRMPGRFHMEPGDVRHKWQRLVRSAGLPVNHDQLRGSHPLARTIAAAIANGYIVPGELRCGRQTLFINLE